MKSLVRNRPAVCLLLSLILLALVPAVLATSGVITVFNPGGSIQTYPASINNHGAITGWHNNGSFLIVGFVRQEDGTVTNFDATSSNNTSPVSINNNGAITGFCLDPSRPGFRGFVRKQDGA